MSLEYNKKDLEKICRDKKIIYLALFGSTSRNEEKLMSDIDLIVDYSKPTGLLNHANTENVLMDFFKKKVDLVLEKNIKPRIKPYILNDLKVLYEKR